MTAKANTHRRKETTMTQAEFNQFIESTCSATIVDPESLADGRGSTPSGLLSLVEQPKATV